MRHPGRGAAIAIACLVASGTALAQPSADGEAKARALFAEATAAIDKGDYASACPKFEAAMQFYASPSTQLNIAQCLEHDGKIASAWAAYQRAATLNHDTKDQRRREAIDKLAKDGWTRLEPSLPRIKIIVSVVVPGLRVTDGTQELPAASFGIALPTDPGPHQLVATAPGYDELRMTVVVEKGRELDVPIVLKESAKPPPPTVPPPPPTVPPPPPVQQPSTPAVEPATSRSTGTPAWAWVSGGVGLVALGVGAGFGGLALGKQGSISSACGAQFPHCPNDAKTMSDVGKLVDARNLDRGVFIGLTAVGGAAIVAAVIGIVAGPGSKERAAKAGLVISPFGDARGGGLVARGGF